MAKLCHTSSQFSHKFTAFFQLTHLLGVKSYFYLIHPKPVTLGIRTPPAALAIVVQKQGVWKLKGCLKAHLKLALLYSVQAALEVSQDIVNRLNANGKADRGRGDAGALE